MFPRIALLLAVFAAPVMAAPVPDREPRFGADGVLLPTELEKLTYGEPSNDNKLALAAYVPKVRYRPGEPILAYFVVRNRTDKPVGLDMRFHLFDDSLREWNSCSYSLRCLTPDAAPVMQARANVISCGGGPLVEVRERGYYVAGGELSRAFGGQLPAGDYELSWAYTPEKFGAKSNAVRFTVAGSDVPVPRRHPTVGFLALTESGDGVRRQKLLLDDSEQMEVWDKPGLEMQGAGGLAAALGSGVGGRYYPDVRRIPDADGVAKVSARWRKERQRDILTVTFEPVKPAVGLRYRQQPKFYLQVEGKAGDGELGPKSAMENMRDEEVVLTQPMRTEIHLPKDWRKRTGLTGPGRVAVFVCSEELKLQSGRLAQKIQRKVELKLDSLEPDAPLWSGVLRTPFVDMDFP